MNKSKKEYIFLVAESLVTYSTYPSVLWLANNKKPSIVIKILRCSYLLHRKVHVNILHQNSKQRFPMGEINSLRLFFKLRVFSWYLGSKK